jgi:hypothetical protein
MVALAAFFRRRAVVRTVVSLVVAAVLLYCGWRYVPWDKLAQRRTEEAWTISKRTNIFVLSGLGFTAFLIGLGVKRVTQGRAAMAQHLTKHLLESLVPAAAAFLLFVVWNMFYVSPIPPRVSIWYGGSGVPIVNAAGRYTLVLSAPPAPAILDKSTYSTQSKLSRIPRDIKLRLIFKDSALLTPKRQRYITSTMEQFRIYLSLVGFDAPRELPPIGTQPGASMSQAWTDPGAIYDAQLRIPEKWLENPDQLRSVYGQWMFISGFRAPSVVDALRFENLRELSASVFNCYYRSSFANTSVCSHEWEGKKWIEALWSVRQSKGQEFTDSIVFYTFKGWRWPSRNESPSFNDLFNLRLMDGIFVKANDEKTFQYILSVLRSYGLTTLGRN